MSLKFRLLLSYIAMFVVPIFLSTVAIVFVGLNQLEQMRQAYEITSEETELIENPLGAFRFATNDVFNELQEIASASPDKFINKAFLESYNHDLMSKRSYLVIRENADLIFIGNMSHIDSVEHGLPGFGGDELVTNRHLLIGEEPLIVRQQDFYFGNGDTGSFFIVTDLGLWYPTMKNLVFKLIFIIIFILAGTNACLTLWMSRAIITPIRHLKMGADNIKNGNLDFHFYIQSEDEIGELCIAFEQMRAKLKESIDSLTQYDNDRKELVSNISHDLKTPITAIKGYVEGIMDGVADTPEKMDRYIQTIYTKATDMDRLIDELFLYSKLDLEKIPFEFQEITIHDYMEDCLDELIMDLEKQGINTIYENNCEKDLRVLADPEQLKRVIINIVSNSAKYMDKADGELQIRLEETDAYIRFEIEDNGKGIKEEDIPNVFNRFYRGDASRNSSKGGSGIGLSIAKKIVGEHGGKIWLESKENIGTTIYFTLIKA